MTELRATHAYQSQPGEGELPEAERDSFSLARRGSAGVSYDFVSLAALLDTLNSPGMTGAALERAMISF